MTLEQHRRDEIDNDDSRRHLTREAIADLYGIDPRRLPMYPTDQEIRAAYVPEFMRPGIDPNLIPDAPMCDQCSKTRCDWCVFSRCPVCRWPLLPDGWCSMCSAADVQGLPGIDAPSADECSDTPTDTDA